MSRKISYRVRNWKEYNRSLINRGVTEQHYNQYNYDDEKRHALDAWSLKLI